MMQQYNRSDLLAQNWVPSKGYELNWKKKANEALNLI
jgi:hypothetical protein